MERVFRLWSRDRFAPRHKAPPPALIIVVNNGDDELLEQFSALYKTKPRLARHFSELVTVSADLTGDADLYVRKEPKAKGRYGNKAGPNFLFQKAMHFAAPYGDYALQIELDCLPTGPAWIDRTLDVIQRNKGAWVIGSAYVGKVNLDPQVQFHLNGNAIYKAGDPNFIDFLDNIWIRRILDHLEENPNLAYDCWWAYEMDRASSAERNDSWRLWQKYDRLFRNDSFLVNLRVGTENLSDFLKIHDRFAKISSPPVFYHGQAITEVINELCNDPNQDLSSFLRNPGRSLTPPKGPARLILHQGFHPVSRSGHGPGGCRTVWTSGQQTEITPLHLSGDLVLPFRIEPKFAIARNGPPGLCPEPEQTRRQPQGHSGRGWAHRISGNSETKNRDRCAAGNCLPGCTETRTSGSAPHPWGAFSGAGIGF